MTRALRLPIGLVLVALVWTAAPVQAHAWLLSSEPGENAQVQTAPTGVVLRFTENVEREYTGASVVDLDGERVDDGRVLFYPEGRRNEIVVPLTAVGDGVYTVKWRTLSVDTHTAAGQFLFAVGNASLAGVSPGALGGHEHGADDPGFWFEAAARAAFYAGLAAAIGLPLFLLVVWPAAWAPVEGEGKRAAADRSGPIQRSTRRAALVALVVAAVGALAGAVVLSSFADRIEADSISAAFSTRTGQYLAGRIAALALAAATLGTLALPRTRQRHARPILLTVSVLGVAAAFLTSLSSHAASVLGKGSLPFLADLVHVVGASVWIGGLLAFAVVLPGPDAPASGRLVRRFSPLAMAAVGALLASGIYASLLHVGSYDELFSTLYGRAILVKAGLLAVLIGFGAWNQFRLGPRLRANRARPSSLDRSVTAEASLLAIVILAAGLLSTTAPPSAEASGARAGVYQLEKQLETVHLVVEITPSPVRVGVQNFTITLHPMTQDPVPSTAEVFLKFQPPEAAEPDEILSPQKTASATWFLSGGYFTERGNWTLHVIVQGPEYAKVPFRVNVQ